MSPFVNQPPWLLKKGMAFEQESSKAELVEFIGWLNSLPIDQRQAYEKRFYPPLPLRNIYQQGDPNHDEDYLIHNDYRVFNWQKFRKSHLTVKTIGQSAKKQKFLFFWGHRPAANALITKSCFSQWWIDEFTISGEKFCCMEQYMMAAKARLFGDEDMRLLIMANKDPKSIKALGRGVRGFDESVWDRFKYSIVSNGNYYKFLQNKPLLDFILSTSSRILVEASPYDKVWGIGLQESDENVDNPKFWRGENLLGFALTQIRDDLASFTQYLR
ncbi:NADAR family protein [Bartonella sp. HY406]|uniref:NADAR family protein n=1 Tax=Bartonella sp. HY406 TaxID=2979331 RepID=UPI0021C995CF|nr:NADAR family protein [Bartonella sp. HY406]UXN02542.1 NADAR family protein [Bartonella sp. HY406]